MVADGPPVNPVAIFKTVEHILSPFKKLHQNTLAIGPHIGKL